MSEWVRAGATEPNEMVLDDFAALISAACKDLGDTQSAAAYKVKSFAYFSG